MAAEHPEAPPAGSVAADLADLIYERWMAAGAAGDGFDHAGIEALVTLSDCLRNYADDPKGSEATMRAAVRILVQLPERPPHGQFQLALIDALRRQMAR